MNYAEWLKTLAEEIRNDPLWNQEAYRLSLFAADLAWHDSTKLFRDALGSARESRTWYFDGRHVLSDSVSNHRIKLHTQIVKLLLTMLPSTPGYSLPDTDASDAMAIADDFEPFSEAELAPLPNSAPLPEH